MQLTGNTVCVLGRLAKGDLKHYGGGDLYIKKLDRAAFSGMCVLTGIVETIADYDDTFFQRHSLASVLSFVKPLLGMDHGLAIKRLKYVTAFYCAVMLRQKELPVPDDKSWDPWLFSGKVRQYLKTQVSRRLNARRAILSWSYYQSKRACDAVPESFVTGEYEKHRKNISKQSAPISDALKQDIETKTDEIISTWSPFTHHLSEPSHSACFENGRCDGGQHRELLREIDGIGYADDLVAMLEVRPGVVVERRGWLPYSSSEILHFAYESEEGRGEKILIPGGTVTDQYLTGLPCGLPDEYQPAHIEPDLMILGSDGKGRMRCAVSGVLEPLKVRTITKGRALPYYAVHSVQKWMHTNLRKFEQFILIGQTVNEDIMKKFFAFRQAGESFVSGDYSAATDNLKIAVTKAIFERILRKLKYDLDGTDLPNDWQPTEADMLIELSRKVLYEHDIDYPKNSGVQSTTQATGQLMGSPLSFPILCIANAIACWVSLFPEKSFKDLPILVNGDDIAFCCTEARYLKWSADLEQFGFVKSIGKNYFHDRFVIINSEFFDSKYEATGKCHLSYFCSGLLLGRSKVAKNEEDMEKPPVIVSLDLCLKGSFNPTRTLSRFMAYHSAEVNAATAGRLSLFLPITKGGLGISSSGAKKMRRDGVMVDAALDVSLWQRKYATWLGSQSVLSTTNMYYRESTESEAWLPTYRHLDTSLKPDFRGYLPLTREQVDELEDQGLPVEQTWLPGLTSESRTEFSQRLHQRTREYANSIRCDGPPGWRLTDLQATVAKRVSSIRRPLLRTIEKCRPATNSELSTELPYRWSTICWDHVPKIFNRLSPKSAERLREEFAERQHEKLEQLEVLEERYKAEMALNILHSQQAAGMR